VADANGTTDIESLGATGPVRARLRSRQRSRPASRLGASAAQCFSFQTGSATEAVACFGLKAAPAEVAIGVSVEAGPVVGGGADPGAWCLLLQQGSAWRCSASRPARQGIPRRFAVRIIIRRACRNSSCRGAPLPINGAISQPRACGRRPVRWCCWLRQLAVSAGSFERWSGTLAFASPHAGPSGSEDGAAQAAARMATDQPGLPALFVPTSPDRCARAAGRRSSAGGAAAAAGWGDLGEGRAPGWFFLAPTIGLGSVEGHKPLPPEGGRPPAAAASSRWAGAGRRARCFAFPPPVQETPFQAPH